MGERFTIGGFDVYVTKKDIKNIYLTVHPPYGMVKITAPLKTGNDVVKAFALTKLDWIKWHHRKLTNQARESKREMINRESHYVWGERYLLDIRPYERKARVVLNGKSLGLYVKPEEDADQRSEILERWYRNELRDKAQPLLAHWQKKLSIDVDRLFVRRMKTKWGSCNPKSKSIRLNTELVHKPKEALEFVVVHELLHFFEPRHSARFFKLLDDILPEWRAIRQELNEAPLSYATLAMED